MYEPIVVWPPGSIYTDCASFGYYYDCTYEYPEYQQFGALVCCPTW